MSPTCTCEVLYVLPRKMRLLINHQKRVKEPDAGEAKQEGIWKRLIKLTVWKAPCRRESCPAARQPPITVITAREERRGLVLGHPRGERRAGGASWAPAGGRDEAGRWRGGAALTRKAAIPLGPALGGRQRWSQPVLTAPIRKRDKRPWGARVLLAADGSSAERAAARGRGRLRLMRISGPGAHRVCKLAGACLKPTRARARRGGRRLAALSSKRHPPSLA